MQRNTVPVPKVTCGRIIEQVGAKRVAADAMDALSDYLVEYAQELAHDAAEIARHTGRKTVKGIDIKLAAKNK